MNVVIKATDVIEISLIFFFGVDDRDFLYFYSTHPTLACLASNPPQSDGLSPNPKI